MNRIGLLHNYAECVHKQNIVRNFLKVFNARPVLLLTFRNDKPYLKSWISSAYSIR